MNKSYHAPIRPEVAQWIEQQAAWGYSSQQIAAWRQRRWGEKCSKAAIICFCRRHNIPLLGKAGAPKGNRNNPQGRGYARNKKP